MKELIKTLESVKKNGKAKIITITEADKFLKKRDRPEHLNNLRKITLQVVDVGYSYSELVENNLKKNGINPESFKKEECKYSDKFSENGLVRISKKDADQYYFRYFVNNNNYNETIYVNEKDEVITFSDDDKKFFTSKGPSQKQGEAGLSKEIKPRNLKLENLEYFQKGKRVYNNISAKVIQLLDLEEV